MPDKDPVESWKSQDNRFANAYGKRYKCLSVDYGTLGGERSGVWIFILNKAKSKNILLKKIDNGICRNGTGYAVLCTAPVNVFSKYQDIFDHAFASFKFADNVIHDGGEESGD